MEFWGDDRGQSVQIGAVLLFGFLVIALTTYQTTVVPQQNAEIEYNHNQAVGMDMLDLRNDLLTAGRTGRTTATTVQLGTRYPARAVFINPPPPSGNIETVGTSDESVNVTLGNATADGDVGDYWNGTDRAFNTGALVYSPNYNEYQNAPDTGIDTGTGVVFNAQQDAKIPTTDQQLIQGNRINLVLLAGNLSKGGSYASPLDVRSVSSSENTVEIDSDQNVTITLATRLSVEQWEDLTSEERVLAVEPAGSVNEEFDRVRLVLKSGNYLLSVSKVGVGTVGSAAGTEPAYLTAVSADTVVNEGTEQPVRFELRDELNNPTGGATVNVSLGPGDHGNLSYGGQTGKSIEVPATDHNGEVLVTYVAKDVNGSSTASATVTASFNGAVNADAGNATTNITVVNTDGSRNSSGGGGGAASQVSSDNSITINSSGAHLFFRFDTGGPTFTAVNASIDTTNMPDGARTGLNKIWISSGVVYNANGGEYASDGTTIDIDDTSVTGSTSIRFGDFTRRGGEDLPGDASDYSFENSQPSGSYIVVNVGFDDGTTKTFYIEYTP